MDILNKIKKSRPNFNGVEISANAKDFIDRSLTVDPKKRITWTEVYDHALLKDGTNMIYGALKSKIQLK